MALNTNAALYGKGIFTTVAINGQRPFLWDKHWLRLFTTANDLGIDLTGYDSGSVLRSLEEAIAVGKVVSGRARITFLDESPSENWTGGGEAKTTFSIVTSARSRQLVDLKLIVSPHLVNSTSPLAGIKSCNYLDPLMAFEEAKSRGFDEAVRVNERGEVTSACMANVFWIKGEQLFTPSLKTACLAGTTREYILENIECEEVEAGIEVIREADEIFLTSAGIGVVTVAMFEGKNLKNTGHPITKVLPF